MPLDFIVDTLDHVEDAEKEFFTEADGKYKFDWAKRDEKIKAPVVEKNSELLKKNKKLSDQLQEKDGLLAGFEKFKGVGDDDWKGFEQYKAVLEANGGKLPTQSDTDSILKKWQEDKDRELRKLRNESDTTVNTLKSELERERSSRLQFIKKTQLQDLAAKNNVAPERQASWFKDHHDKFGLDEKGNLIVLDEDGDPRDIDAAKFIAEDLADATPWYYIAKEQGGGGSQGSRGGNSAPRLKRSEMDAAAKAKYIRDYGSEAYNKLPLK